MPESPANAWVAPMTTVVADQVEQGRRCLEMLDVAGAEVAFHEAIARSAGDAAVKESAAKAYRKAGWQAFNIPGGFELAWRIFQNARALFESLGPGQEFEVAKICRGLSITAGKLGDRENSLYYGGEAAAQLARSQVSTAERGTLLAKLRNDRAISLRQLGRLAEAEQLTRENLDWIESQSNLSDRLLAANIHQNHGYQLMDAGLPKAAVQAFQATRARLVAGDMKARLPGCDLRLAEAWLASGALDRAEAVLKQAQAGFRRERATNLWAADLAGRLHLERGDAARARRCFSRALQQADRQRESLEVEDFRMTFQRTVQDVYRRAFALERARPAAAFALAERARARAFLDIVDACERLEFPGLRPSERARLERQRAAIQGYGANGENDAHAAKSAYLMLVRRYEQAVRARRGLPQVEPLSAAAIRRRLAPDEAVVEYFDDGTAMHVFVLRRRGLVRRVLRTRLATIREEVAALPAAVHAARRESRLVDCQT